ncbi:M56 family metallopeptidase [Granulicella sp. dw_53]|uniref:M56 family metallopeptidase n=1 Tax=Granulicella sp. dw_53 TaxID=2719792 RepID=UPI001BD4C0E7|nr:M56 family metallopeptidase [Granulicella sp. dw_53]
MIPQLNQAHHLESLGWTLIHFCWQAAAIALAYKAIDLSFTRTREQARSQTRYLFALVAMLGMFAAASSTFAYEEIRLQRTASLAATQSVTSDIMAEDATPSPSKADAASTTALRSEIIAALPRAESLLPWLDALWMLGVLALSVRTIGGWWLIQRLRSTAIQQVPPELAARFALLSRRIGIQSRVALRLSTRIASPLAVGMFRSLILLPASALTSLSPEQLEAVLAHELAHIRRADYLWNILQTMIETLFFFHPAVWYVGANLRQQRELCCDDIAIACADPVTYATALYLLEEQRSQHLDLRTPNAEFPLALALDGHQTRFTLRSRIARILGEAEAEPFESTTSPRDIAPFSILGVCAALALFLLPLPQVLASLRPTAQRLATASKTAIAAPAMAATTAPLAAAAKATVPASTPALEAPTAEPAPLASPAPLSTARALPSPAAAPALDVDPDQATAPTQASGSKSDYITQMRAAGYDTDLDHYMAMKIHGITPEFAHDLSQVGFGKPSVDDLIALKIHGVTPAYFTELQAAGIKPECFKDVISYRIFHVTPEFISGMKAAGFSNIPTKKLVELRVQNITPDFARTAKQQFPDVTVKELVELRIFHIDDAFIARAKQLGLSPLTIKKLVQLRTSGLLEDESTRR